MTLCIQKGKNSDNANNFSFRGSTVMFKLTKSFSQFCLEIYRDKISFLLDTLHWCEDTKNLKTAQNPTFFVMEN
jgi:hypothetical protein